VIEDLLITPLDIIEVPGGNVMHVMRQFDTGYANFGEAYFSEVGQNAIKAWKRHKKMTLNLIVPIGRVKVVFFDDRNATKAQFQEIILSRKEYYRLTVPPMIWFGFQGIAKSNSMLLNIANIKHDPDEVDRLDLHELNYNWRE